MRNRILYATLILAAMAGLLFAQQPAPSLLSWIRMGTFFASTPTNCTTGDFYFNTATNLFTGCGSGSFPTPVPPITFTGANPQSSPILSIIQTDPSPTGLYPTGLQLTSLDAQNNLIFRIGQPSFPNLARWNAGGQLWITPNQGLTGNTVVISSGGASTSGLLILRQGGTSPASLLQIGTAASTFGISDAGPTLFKVDGNGALTISPNVQATGTVPLTVNAPNGQTANLFQLQVNAATKFAVDTNGTITAGGVRGSVGGGPLVRRISEVTCNGSTVTLMVIGVDNIGQPGTAAGSIGTAALGPSINYQAGAGTSSGQLNRQQTRPGRNATAAFMISLNEHIIAGRYWFGLWDGANAGTAIATDNPAGHYAMVRFSVSASDTTYKFITKDGATQNIIDTGVAPSDSVEDKWTIQDNGSSWTLTRNGVLVATSSSNLPASTQLLGITVSTNNASGGGATQINFHQVHVESDI